MNKNIMLACRLCRYPSKKQRYTLINYNRAVSKCVLSCPKCGGSSTYPLDSDGKAYNPVKVKLQTELF